MKVKYPLFCEMQTKFTVVWILDAGMCMDVIVLDVPDLLDMLYKVWRYGSSVSVHCILMDVKEKGKERERE